MYHAMKDLLKVFGFLFAWTIRGIAFVVLSVITGAILLVGWIIHVAKSKRNQRKQAQSKTDGRTETPDA